MATTSRFDVKAVKSPFQLLAAWLISLIVLDSAFLSAATLITEPAWASGLLVIASILNVPLFLTCMFQLQTRFRPEMQGDEYYSSYLQDQKRINELSEQLKHQLNGAGLDLASLASGRSLDEAPLEVQVTVKEILGELSGGLDRLSSKQRAMAYGVNNNTLLEVAKALMADHKWKEAAKYLDEYAGLNPTDWQAQRSRGIAHAMSRSGESGDAASLNAYNQAIEHVPREIDLNTRGRLYTFRGAMFKRLGRYKEALSDLKLALEKASDELVIRDINYNLACVYALMGERELMLDHLRHIRDAPREQGLIRRHISDYFSAYAQDHEFLALLTEK